MINSFRRDKIRQKIFLLLKEEGLEGHECVTILASFLALSMATLALMEPDKKKELIATVMNYITEMTEEIIENGDWVTYEWKEHKKNCKHCKENDE